MNQDTLWDHSSRSAHFRFDVLKDIKESELPQLKANFVPMNVNRQYATIEPQNELERIRSPGLDQEMKNKPKWENDTLTDNMQFVDKIKQK